MSNPVVGIDLRNVANSQRGYCRMMNLFYEVDELDSDFQFEWITEPTRLTETIESRKRSHLVSPRNRLRLLHRSVLGHLRPLIWEDTKILHFPTADCWYAPTCKTVVTLHDLAPLHYPEWFFGGVKEEKNYRTHLDRIFEVADRVVTVSEYSRNDLTQHYPAYESKIRMIYQGVGPEFFREPWNRDQRTLFRSNIGAPEGYLLYCGGIDARKNLEFLIEVFRELSEDPSFRKKLVIVGNVDSRKGGMPDLRDLAKQKGLGETILLPGWISDDLLRRYYNAAHLFLFPSKMEGFGYAPLEAMASACPTICSNATSIPETVGDASVLVAPDDVSAWVNAIRHALGDLEVRGEVITRGIEWVKRYDWKKTAESFLKVYHEVL